MDVKNSLQNCLNTCKDGSDKLKGLAQTESSQTAKSMLLDAAHHLEVALAECSYTEKNL